MFPRREISARAPVRLIFASASASLQETTPVEFKRVLAFRFEEPGRARRISRYEFRSEDRFPCAENFDQNSENVTEIYIPAEKGANMCAVVPAQKR